MNKQLRRMLALLLCAALVCAAVPAASAVRATDFQQIQQAGEQSGNEIYVVTDPMYYTVNMSEFFGEYVIYQDALTGFSGIADVHGRIVYPAQAAEMTPIAVLCENIFYGSAYSGWLSSREGNLYDFQGNRLEALDTVRQYDCGSLRDQATGETVGAWVGETTVGEPGDQEQMYRWLIQPDGAATRLPFLYGAPQNGRCLTYDPDTERWGLMNLSFETLLPQRYDNLRFVGTDRLLACQNGSYSILTADGALVEALPYDSVRRSREEEQTAYLVCKDGRCGVLDEHLAPLIPLEYDDVSRCGGDVFRFAGTVGDVQYWISEDPAITWHGSRNFPLFTQVLAPNRYLIQDGDASYLEDGQGQRLFPKAVEFVCYNNSGENLLLCFAGSQTFGVYDKNLNLLLEFPSDVCAFCSNDQLILSRTGEDGACRTDFYDQSGQLVKSCPDTQVLLRNRFLLVLQRKDGLCAFSDARGELLTGFAFSDAMEVSSGFDALSYPYVVARRADNGALVLIDGRTGQNAISENATVNSTAILMPEGRYFPFFENDRTGFARLTARDESPFRDVNRNAWYAGAAAFCYHAGLMSGTGRASFSPKTTTTRAMLVTMLYKLSGEKTASHGFTDVPDGKWYSDAVNWAAASGIVGGKTPTTFCPNDPVTREQLVTILNKYAGCFAPQSADQSVLTPYQDADRISAYAREAMAWAVGNGFVSGKTATTLDPKGKATRAEIALIIMHFIQFMAA